MTAKAALPAWLQPALVTACLLGGLALAALRLDLRAAHDSPTHLGSCKREPEALLVPRHQPVPPGDKDSYERLVPMPGLAVDRRVLMDRDFLLGGTEMERAVSLGDSRRLRRQVARLEAGHHVRVVTVGASITCGAGGAAWAGTRTSWPGYVDQFAHWLAAAFPRANATVHNAGLAGTFSGVFAQCFDTLVPEADVYVLEQTTFDGTEPERCFCKNHYVDTPVQLAIERLIRRMLKQAHHPAVLLLNVYGFRFPNREVYQRSVENQVQVMAQFYGLPMASLRAAAWRHMLHGGHGFDVTNTVKLYGERDIPADTYPLYFDQVHPWGPTGHRMLAELLIRMVQAAAAGLSLQPLTAQEIAMPREPLMPPLMPGNYETNSSSCWLGDDFRSLVGTTKGFTWVNERPEAAERQAQKWGFVATQPESFLEFEVDSRVAGTPEGSSNRLVLSYLASYDPAMGIARIACLAGCRCPETEVNALWQEKASLLMTAEVQATQHAECRVRVTVRRNSAGGGHKFKLAGAMVLPAGTNEFSASDKTAGTVVPQLAAKGR